MLSNLPILIRRREGVADEELAKKEAERGRKRKLEEDDEQDGYGKVSRSSRSLSLSSVSTISTNKSRSASREPVNTGHTGQSQLMSGLEINHHSPHSSNSSMSYASDHAYGSRTRRQSYDKPRHSQADRPKSRSLRERDINQPPKWKRRSSRSPSITSEFSNESSKYRPPSTDRSKRRRRASQSPDDRGRGRESDGRWGSRRTHSPSRSRDRSLVTRYRKSMTPGLPSNGGENPYQQRRPSDSRFEGDKSYERQYNNAGRPQTRNTGYQQGSGQRSYAQQRRERSLSPYSKRLALTQAMNMNR